MNAREFFDLVTKMRTAQKNYLRTRFSSDLTLSRNLERQVDAEIERVHNILGINKPIPTLFDQASQGRKTISNNP